MNKPVYVAVANIIFCVVSVAFALAEHSDAEGWILALLIGSYSWFILLSGWVGAVAGTGVSLDAWRTGIVLGVCAVPVALVISWPVISEAVIKSVVDENHAFGAVWALGIIENSIYFALLAAFAQWLRRKTSLPVGALAVIGTVVGAGVIIGRLYFTIRMAGFHL